MVPGQDTDKLYLADCLPAMYPEFYESFKKCLRDANIDCAFIPYTRDVWAVDFMPIQVNSNKFIRFRYNPDYLRPAKWQKTISDVGKICDQMKIAPIESNIVLDGGNVVNSSGKVILCDKVFEENPSYTRKELISKLETLFEVDQVYFVPQQKNDFTGHADGMLRFLDDNTVLINDYSKESKEFQRAFKIALHNARLDYIELPYDPYKNSNYSQANGTYVNFLQMKHAVFVPTFGLEMDGKVIEEFERLFSSVPVIPIPSNQIANSGGVLNCISWNIKADSGV